MGGVDPPVGEPVSNLDDLGQLVRLDGVVQVTFTRSFPHAASTVWRALTEPEHLGAWFPTTIEGDRAVGARLRFCFRNDEAQPFDGEMLAYEPPVRMTLQWGDEVLRFEIQPDATGSILTLTVTFDQLGKMARDGAGWHACLDLLGCEVAQRQAPWSSADRWSEVHAIYIDRFGPEASTIGPPEEWMRLYGAADGIPEGTEQIIRPRGVRPPRA